jgi:hypothetical protein
VISPPQANNPFTQRGRITNPEYFIGRWRELSLLFDRIETRRPVLINGVPGIGRSSLITHVVQSAAANFDDPSVAAFYLDLVGVAQPEQIFQTLIAALNGRGDSLAALELALIESGRPTVVCLDNAEHALSQAWGERFVEQMARMARTGALMLVVALHGEPPLLSERYAAVTLGAFQPAEIRMLCDTYLEGTNVNFSPSDYAALAHLSGGHPAYLQRAAFHLFRAKHDPGYNWKARYREEVRDQGVPGAPLPPGVFEGEEPGAYETRLQEEHETGAVAAPPAYVTGDDSWALPAVGLIAVGLVVAFAGYWWVALALLAAGGGLAWLARRH